MAAKDHLWTAERVEIQPCYRNASLNEVEEGYAPEFPLQGYRLCAIFPTGNYSPSGEVVASHRYVGRIHKTVEQAVRYADKVLSRKLYDEMTVTTWDAAKAEYETWLRQRPTP